MESEIDRVFDFLLDNENFWEAITDYGEWNHPEIEKIINQLRNDYKEEYAK